eukprot:scaffold617_cov92-Isochrysis_galbana.AAC.1
MPMRGQILRQSLREMRPSPVGSHLGACGGGFMCETRDARAGERWEADAVAARADSFSEIQGERRYAGRGAAQRGTSGAAVTPCAADAGMPDACPLPFLQAPNPP